MQLSPQAIRTLRDIKRKVFTPSDSPADIEHEHYNYDIVVFTPQDVAQEADGTKLSTLKYVSADDDNLELISDGECYAIEVNDIPDA